MPNAGWPKPKRRRAGTGGKRGVRAMKPTWITASVAAGIAIDRAQPAGLSLNAT